MANDFGIEARVLENCLGPQNQHVTTFYTNFHKIVLGERNRHRSFSLSDRSSRAVPTKKYIEEVRTNPAIPVKFKKEMKGMGSTVELEGAEALAARARWIVSANRACDEAEEAMIAGESKETVNRRLDPYVFVPSIVTSCAPGLLNWFGLRLDQGADPTIRVLAEEMWIAWNEAKLIQLYPGDWSMPLTDGQDLEIAGKEIHRLHDSFQKDTEEESLKEFLKRISIARCARTSFVSFVTGKRATFQEDLDLYARLVGSQPLHASPSEHQCTPDTVKVGLSAEMLLEYGTVIPYEGGESEPYRWARPELHGNLPGFVQYRKTLSGEAIAPLPEGLEYNRPEFQHIAI